jgi:hypothetical protein
VEPHPDADLGLGQRALCGDGSRHGVARSLEGDEEPVPGRIDLVAAVSRECLTQQTPVLAPHMPEPGADARKFHRLVVTEIRRSGGRELEVVGDTVLATFERPLDAVRAAKALREALQNKPWFPGDEPPPVSIGIHSGRVADPSARHLGTTGPPLRDAVQER